MAAARALHVQADRLSSVHACCLFLSVLSNKRERECSLSAKKRKTKNLTFDTNSAQEHFTDLTFTKDSVCPSNYAG